MQATDYIEGVIADISDRKQAEAVLRQSEAQFQEQQSSRAFRADIINVGAKAIVTDDAASLKLVEVL